MSKIFNWFKKEKPKQDSSDPDAQTQKEELASTEPEIEQSQSEDNRSADAKEATGKKPDVEKSEDDLAATAKDEANSAEASSATNEEPSVMHQSEAALTPEPIVPAAQIVKEATEEAELESQAPAKDQSEPSLFARLKASLSRTKNTIGSGFTSLLLGKAIDEDLYEELETQLLLADVGMTTTNKIISELTKNAKSSQLKDGGALSEMLREQMQTILDTVNKPLDFSLATDENGNKHPFVILMVGVNGVGKTTTIGKLAKQFQAQGKSVMLAAGDTFRAAAVEQLQVWGERNDIAVVAQHTGADSASVIFDALESAKAKNTDVLIADTAGRLQNKDHLIEELKKVVRVMKKLNPQAPHEIMLTLDASTGQNAVSQTRIFNEAVGISGINLTKLDGTAKGGVIFALADEFAIPVRYIGIGEGIDDLRSFESKAFVDALFAE